MTMEVLLTYFFLLCNFITYLASYKFLTKDKIKVNFLNIVLLILLTFVALLIRYNSNILLILFSNIVIIFLLLKYFYKLPLVKSVYYSLICVIISLFCDAFLSLILNSNYLKNYEIFQRNFYIRNLLNIPLCLLILLICSLSYVQKISSTFYSKYIDKIETNKNALNLISILIILILISFYLNVYNGVGKIGHSIYIFSILSFTLIFIVVLYLLYKEYQTKILTKKIINENKYMKDIARQEKEFKHNLINNLLGIKTVATKKVNQLIDELISEYKTDYKNILNINDLPDGVLSIIYRKAYEENIDNLNLAVDNKIKKDLIDMLSPKNYNKFCTSIGILFDNALDAVKSCKEKIIEINFLEDEEYIYYIQKNSFNNIIDLERTGTKEYTTKKSGHGIGLNYVKNLKNIETKNEVINNMFITKLKVKKIKM